MFGLQPMKRAGNASVWIGQRPQYTDGFTIEISSERTGPPVSSKAFCRMGAPHLCSHRQPTRPTGAAGTARSTPNAGGDWLVKHASWPRRCRTGGDTCMCVRSQAWRLRGIVRLGQTGLFCPLSRWHRVFLFGGRNPSSPATIVAVYLREAEGSVAFGCRRSYGSKWTVRLLAHATSHPRNYTTAGGRKAHVADREAVA
jgi:hypothetical protein